MGLPKLEPPFGVTGVAAEQDAFDRLDFRRQMLVSQPISDRPVADPDRIGERPGSPRASGTIDAAARPRAAQQMPAQQPPESPAGAIV